MVTEAILQNFTNGVMWRFTMQKERKRFLFKIWRARGALWTEGCSLFSFSEHSLEIYKKPEEYERKRCKVFCCVHDISVLIWTDSMHRHI